MEYKQDYLASSSNSGAQHPCYSASTLTRALRGRLHTNEKLSSFGIEPADCLCCHPAGVDTIDHIFNAGIFAKKNLWKNGCAIKYEGKQSNISRVKFLVFKDTFKLLHTVFPYITWPSSWMETVILNEKCFHETNVTLVQWMKPPDVWFKINTDGSALDNLGSIGAGGILRNTNKDLIFSYSVPLGHGTNNQVEVEAAVFGLS
ncbi:hypothetical protein KY289_014067 [Solanum tuberosum]|nr:hypothetical protein KY289_014067 [Solanum tuberosum]